MTDSQAEQRLAAAWAGNQQAFSELSEPYRAELLVHCYRLLGSLQDAEDMVQETFLRAWHRLSQFTGGPYFRAWLYKIATNICLDALDKRARRGLPPARFPAADPRAGIAPAITEPIWLEPFPDERLPETAPGPEARYTLRESLSLAFLAALQRLPPRQRVILILCDVLDWRAREAAQLLDLTVAAVNGLLRRARATLAGDYHPLPPAPKMDHQIRALLNRYVEAWETGDVDLLVTLLADKVIFSMPPSPTWYSGRAAVRVHAQVMFLPEDRDRWRLQPTRANQQLAFACYRLAEADGTYQAHALQVLTLAGAQITEMNMFLLPPLFSHFGLASHYSPGAQETRPYAA
jgi:RNA polymerase sigma-70 factor (ECF subfamily)